VRWLLLAISAAALGVWPAFAQEGPQQAYVTADPGRSDRVGLATQDGRYALVLGDGCDQVVPGVNVLMSTDDAGGLLLQVVDPILGVQDQAYSVLDQERVGDTPCGKNPAGQCDVGWA
jgi:hypothetical protein